MRRREPAGGNVIQAQRTGVSGKEPDEGMEEGPDPSFEAAMPCGAWTPGGSSQDSKSRFRFSKFDTAMEEDGTRASRGDTTNADEEADEEAEPRTDAAVP